MVTAGLKPGGAPGGFRKSFRSPGRDFSGFTKERSERPHKLYSKTLVTSLSVLRRMGMT